MTLWTYQSPDWEFWDGVYDPRRANYSDDARIMSAYKKLFECLGTDKLIWCSGYEWQHKPSGKIEYRIDIPDHHQRWYSDMNVWNWIIGKHAYSDAMFEFWRTSTRHLRNDEYRAEYERLQSSFRTTLDNFPDHWAELIKTSPSKHTDILVAIPLDKAWIT